MKTSANRDVPSFWAAADLAKAGYKVFPVRDKAPSVEGGFYAATADVSQVAEWITEGREYHDVAFATGVLSGVVVIDADTPEASAKMREKYGEPHVKTRRGGHWYFRHPRKGKIPSNPLGEGLDRKGDGGYVVAPPSRGREWTNGIPKREALAVLPPELGEKPKPRKDGGRTTTPEQHERAVETISRHVAGIPQGSRHEHLKHLCGVLLSRDLATEDVERILIEAWSKVDGGLAERAEREVPNTLRTTEEAIAEGRATGVPKMEEITPGLFAELEDVFGWKVKATFGERPSIYERNGDAHGAHGILLSEVVPERVRWLWEGRIALGKLNLVDGDPGTGKSAATTDLAARVSVGKPWPDGSECQAGGVVILSAEDGLADTIRPRFDAAGGDPSRAVALSTVPDAEGTERQISIPDDISVIEAAIERVGAVLVVIDPLMAFLPGEVNSHRDQDVRRALAPLARLAERTGAAIVVVRHLNKANGGNVLYRGGGSIGIVGAARSGLLIAKHPEDDGRRVLASIKSNLAPPAPSLVFSLSGTESGAVRVDWKGSTPLDASALLSAPTDHEERSALSEAQEFLREVLAAGPVAAAEVRQEADAAGIAKRTLGRARQSLGVLAEREGESGKRGGGKLAL